MVGNEKDGNNSDKMGCFCRRGIQRHLHRRYYKVPKGHSVRSE